MLQFLAWRKIILSCRYRWLVSNAVPPATNSSWTRTRPAAWNPAHAAIEPSRQFFEAVAETLLQLSQQPDTSKAASCSQRRSERSGRVLGQPQRFSGEIASGVKRSADVTKQAALEGLKREIDDMRALVQNASIQSARVRKRPMNPSSEAVRLGAIVVP